MTRFDLSAASARRGLAGTVDAADGDDVVVAYARAIWSVLIEPGDRVAGSLIGALGADRALELALTDSRPLAEAEEADVDPQDLAQARARWRPRAREIDAALARARGAGVQLVTPEDAAWPRRADDLGPHAPVCLWVHGDLRALASPRPAVALVGARASSSYGEFVAAEMASEAAAAEVAVYSGGAYGIDGAAHRAVLAAGGRTVAVMAGGVDRPYPAGHRDLLERVARSGAVIAEVACGTAPTKHRFLLRNRLIAVLSDATVVVEAGWRSGAVNTVHHAAELGRPVGAVPGPVTSASSMGCHRLLREGIAQCVTGFGDVAELIGSSVGVPAAMSAEESRWTDRTDDRTRILDALSARSVRATEDVARRAGVAYAEAATLLALLELEGAIARRATGWLLSSKAGTATLW